MKEYTFKLPIVGYAIVAIEDEDEKSALSRAFDNVDVKDIEEWLAVEKVVSGNVLYAPLNAPELISVEEIE